MTASGRASRGFFVLLLAWAGCFRPSAPASANVDASAAPAPKMEEACTLATPLIPGVPGSPGHLMPSSINPNGQSELSQLMRTMQGELKLARTAIARGEKVAPLLPRFRKIRCAWPTNPRDRNESFDALAQNYLRAVSSLDEAPPAQAAGAFENVLNACRSCHEQSCSGALVAIEALRLSPVSTKN